MGVIDFTKYFGPETLLFDEPMSKHSNFRVGGLADVIFMPKDADEIVKMVGLCKENGIDFFVMGSGSNLLVTDKGFRGVIIKLSANFKDIIQLSTTKFFVDAKVKLPILAKYCCDAGLTGLEFAAGIPGTVGGATFMNAGAYGGEMKDIITSVKVLNHSTGEIYTLSSEEMKFSYRYSIAKDSPLIILGIEISLQEGKKEDIKQKMLEFNQSRIKKQPIHLPSGGSTFKRPAPDIFAGKLIEDCGLKGYSIGGAGVSDLHAGFIVNNGGATATDILDLIEYVKNIVKENFNISLQEEIIVLGEK